VAGVAVHRGGAAVPQDDFYFADATETRSTLEPSATATGADGTALVVNSSAQLHSGAGAEPNTCSWPSFLAASAPGLVFVQLVEAQAADGGSCP